MPEQSNFRDQRLWLIEDVLLIISQLVEGWVQYVKKEEVSTS